MRRLKQQKNAGFTLLEMIVAIGVFIVVVTVSLSAFLNVHDIQVRMSAFRAANDSLNFVVESMAREIKEGTDHQCGFSGGSYGLCGDEISYDKIKFNTVDTLSEIEYEFDDTKIKRNTADFTPSNVTIGGLSSFIVRGFAPFSSGNYQQPLVIITIQGEAGSKEKLKSRVNIQTTVSLRQLDLDL